MSKPKVSGTAAALGCATIIFAIPVIAILNAWAVTKMCGWFVPALHVGMLLAYGVSVIIAMFTATPKADMPDDDQTFTQSVVQGLISAAMKPLFLLLIGWLVHLVFQ